MAEKVHINTLIIITIIGCYAFFWVRFKMKKNIFGGEPISDILAD
jgi:hypothetical protein